MSTLTKKERDGLDDVFLSIHTNGGKYKKFKDLSPLIITSQISNVLSKLLKRAILGQKKKKILNFLSYLYKKKKSLSK